MQRSGEEHRVRGGGLGLLEIPLHMQQKTSGCWRTGRVAAQPVMMQRRLMNSRVAGTKRHRRKSMKYVVVAIALFFAAAGVTSRNISRSAP